MDYQMRKYDILCKKERGTDVLSLATSSSIQLFRHCCNISQKGDRDSLNRFRNSLQALPKHLWKELKRIYWELSYWSFEKLEDETWFEQKLGHLLPNDIVQRVKNMEFQDNSSLLETQGCESFNLWYLFSVPYYGNVYTQSTSFVSALASHLETSPDTKIMSLNINYDENLKFVFPKLLRHLEHSLEKLTVNVMEGTENEVLDFVSKSNCQLEKFSFHNRTNLKLDGLSILKYLRKHEKTLKELDLSKFLNEASNLSNEGVYVIFKQISQMKRLQKLEFFAPKGTENEILKYISNCESPLEEIRFKGREYLKFEPQMILKFLASHSKTITTLDISQWLEDIQPIFINNIFLAISRIRNLKKLRVFALDLIDTSNYYAPLEYSLLSSGMTKQEKSSKMVMYFWSILFNVHISNLDKYHRLQYLNIPELTLEIEKYRGDNYVSKKNAFLS